MSCITIELLRSLLTCEELTFALFRLEEYARHILLFVDRVARHFLGRFQFFGLLLEGLALGFDVLMPLR